MPMIVYPMDSITIIYYEIPINIDCQMSFSGNYNHNNLGSKYLWLNSVFL